MSSPPRTPRQIGAAAQSLLSQVIKAKLDQLARWLGFAMVRPWMRTTW